MRGRQEKMRKPSTAQVNGALSHMSMELRKELGESVALALGEYHAQYVEPRLSALEKPLWRKIVERFK